MWQALGSGSHLDPEDIAGREKSRAEGRPRRAVSQADMQRAGPGSHHLGPEDIAAVQATGGGLHITAHLHVGPRRDPFRGEGSSAAYRVSYVSPGDTQMDRPEEASTSLPTCTSVQGISAQQVRREGAGVPTSTAGTAGSLRRGAVR